MKSIQLPRRGILTLPGSKHPDGTRRYRVNWEAFLDALGDTIATSGSAWSEATGELTLSGDGIDADSLGTYVTVSGGTDGVTYTITNTITTNTLGLIEPRSFKLLVEKR